MIDFDKVLEHVGGFGKYQITSKSYRWLVWEPKFESGMSGKASGLDEDLTKNLRGIPNYKTNVK